MKNGSLPGPCCCRNPQVRHRVARLLQPLLLISLLLLSSCSVFRSDSLSVDPPRDRTQTIPFTPLPGSKAFHIEFDEPSLFTGKLFGLSLEECNRKPRVSVSGKSRQLLVSFDSLQIQKRRELEASIHIAALHATAAVDGKSISLVGYTWNHKACVYDFLVWSEDASLLPAEHDSENATIAVLDRYITSTVNNYVS